MTINVGFHALGFWGALGVGISHLRDTRVRGNQVLMIEEL